MVKNAPMQPRSDICGDLVFRCDGQLYDGTTLIRLETDDPRAPAVFVTPDHLAAFVVTINDIGIINVRAMGHGEIRALAKRNPHPALREAVRKSVRTPPEQPPPAPTFDATAS